MLSPICPMSNPSAADASTEIDTMSAEPVRSRMLPGRQLDIEHDMLSDGERLVSPHLANFHRSKLSL